MNVQQVGYWRIIRPYKHPTDRKNTYSWCRCLLCDSEKPVVNYDLKRFATLSCRACSARRNYQNRPAKPSRPPAMETPQSIAILKAIAAAKAQAIADGTYTMPPQYVLTDRAGVVRGYLRSGTTPAIIAQHAMHEAKASLATLKKAVVTLEQVQQAAIAPAVKPSLSVLVKSTSHLSKQTRLLAHLKLQPRYLSNLHILLGVERRQIDAIVQPLIDQGLCEIKHYPFDKTGQAAKLLLKQRHQRQETA